MERKKEIVALFLLIVVIGFFYAKILGGFFVQDEWYGFGWFLAHQDLKWLESIKFFFASDVGHYNPLTNMLSGQLFFLWGIDYTKFAILGITLHIFVTLALFVLAKIIFKGNRLLAFFTASIFGVFASPFQGVAWVVTNIATLSSSFFGIVSIILFFTFLNKERIRLLGWSLFFLLVSLFFKEITIGLLPLFLVLCLVRSSGRVKRKSISLIAVFAGGYILFRIAMFFVPHQTGPILVGQSRPSGVAVYNFVTLPVKSLAQTIISPEFIKEVSFGLAGFFPPDVSGIPGSPEFEKFAVERIMEVVSLILGLTLFIVGIKFRVYFGLGWVFLNSLIFSISPGVYRPVFVVDSRNLYFVSLGTAIFLVALLNLLARKRLKTLIIFLSAVLILNIYWLNSNLSNFIKAGSVRKNILEKIAGSYPQLPAKVVFFTLSDRSYYGLPFDEKILPFQSGLGQTLLIYYSAKEKFPRDFYPGDYLWEIKSQGYQEHGGRGFGYFRDLELLKKTVREYNIPKEAVVAFSWSSTTHELQEITAEIRKKI